MHTLPYFELSGGVRYAYAFTNNWAVQRLPQDSIFYERQERNNYGIAWNAKLMASNAIHFFRSPNTKYKKWKIADIFLCELQVGFRRKQIEQKNNLLLGYHFGIGVGVSYQLKIHNAVGICLLPLKFSDDGVSPAISGSWAAFRYIQNKIWLEIGVEARDLSFFGYLVKSTISPKQYFIQLVWKKKWGLRCEWAHNRYIDNTYNGFYQNFYLTVCAFYGKFF